MGTQEQRNKVKAGLMRISKPSQDDQEWNRNKTNRKEEKTRKYNREPRVFLPCSPKVFLLLSRPHSPFSILSLFLYMSWPYGSSRPLQRLCMCVHAREPCGSHQQKSAYG